MNDYWREIVENLIKSGLADKDPFLHKACGLAWKGYPVPLSDILKHHPSLPELAKTIIAEQEDDPFWRPPLKLDETEALSGEYKIGEVNHRGDMVGLDPLDFTRIMLVLGNIGSGKSYAINAITDQMLQQTVHERKFNIWWFEYLKTDITGTAKRYADRLYYLTWDDIRYNGWQVFDWDTTDEKIRAECRIFAGEHYMFAHSLPIFSQAAQITYGQSRNPRYSDIRDNIPAAAKQMGLSGYEQKNLLDKLKINLNEAAGSKSMNCRDGYPWAFWLENDICLNIKDAPNDYLARYLVMSLLLNLQRFYEKFPTLEPRLRTLIISHESRYLFDAKKDKGDYPSNTLVERFATTSRSSGIGQIHGLQEPDAASRYLLDNATYTLAFPVFAGSVESVKHLQGLNDDQAQAIYELPPYGQAIMRDPRHSKPFIVTIPEWDAPKPAPESELKELNRQPIDILQEGLPIDGKPEPLMISELWRENNKVRMGLRMLNVLKNQPFAFYSEIFEELNKKYPAEKKDLTVGIDWLKSEGLIQELDIGFGRGGQPRRYFPLTVHGQNSLGIPWNKRISRSHFKHTLYCETVKLWLEGEGHKSQREMRVTRDGQVQADGRIDVFAVIGNQAVAYEIQLSLKKTDVLSNVEKCFFAFKIDHLWLVCESSADIEKAKGMIVKAHPKLYDRISYSLIREFL